MGEKENGAPHDVIVPVLQVPGGVAVVRMRPDSNQIGVIRPVSDGQDLYGREIVSLTPREDGPGYDAVTEYDGRSSPGPAMVNSRGYRDGWDRVFGDRGGGPGMN